MKAIISVDLGTTAIKCALFDEKGNNISNDTEEYQLTTSEGSIVEVDVEVYWRAFIKSIKTVLNKSKFNPNDILAMGISAQGETLILVDKVGKPLRPAIVWLDNRAQDEADYLAGKLGHRHSYEITGQVKLVPTWPASKILWLQRNEPMIIGRVGKFLLIEDYFIYRMTGEYVCEGSLITSTCYWNFRTKTWWDEMLDILEIKKEQLPIIMESGVRVGPLIPEVADELGLSKDTIICTGALDQACGAIGVGNIQPGVFSENTGAALAICATVSQPIIDPNNQMPCHYHGIPDLYMEHTFTSGGMVLRWFRDEFAKMEIQEAIQKNLDAYDLLGEIASKVPPGCEGLVMLPHLQGAMAPEANPKAKGVFYGFTLNHGKSHFARSIMESVAYIVKRNIEVIEGLGITVNEIRASGGGARSRLWKQIEADITQRPVITTENDEAATTGAAILAGKAIGIYSNIKEASLEMVHVKEQFLPQDMNFNIYEKAYQTYIDLYDQLCPLFDESVGV